MVDTIYNRFGTKPAINARGIYTDLGGSILSPRVWNAMEEANRWFVEFPDLLDRTGQIIAGMVGAEAARVTPGASAGIMLGVAASITGMDPDKLERIPNTTDMKHEVLIQRAHRYPWDRVSRLAGADLIEVGDEGGTTRHQFSAAISSNTAATLVPGHLDGVGGSLRLRDAATIVRGRGVPTIVDAAYLNYPLDRFGKVLRDGADLAIFSAKYFGGPNTGGFICGRSDLIQAVAELDFTSVGTRETVSFGRALKLDRQLVIGVVEALQEWFEMDHDARFADYELKVQLIASRLQGIQSIELTPMCLTMEEELVPDPINCLVVRIDPKSGTTACRVSEGLRAGTPSILVHHRDDALILDVECVSNNDAEIIGERVHEELFRQ